MEQANSSLKMQGARLACEPLTQNVIFLYDQNLDNILLTSSIMTIIFSLIAILGNSLVISTICLTSSLQTPSNILIVFLAFSDLGVGLLAQPAFAVYRLAEMKKNFDWYCYSGRVAETVAMLTTLLSVFSVTAISVERLLAVSLHLRYKELVTTRRVVMSMTLIWLFPSVLSVILKNILSNGAFKTTSIVTFAILVLINLYCYVTIFQVIRKLKTQVNVLPVSSTAPNVKQQTKSVFTLLYIVGLSLLCYLPYIASFVLFAIKGYTLTVRESIYITSVFVFVSSSLNPVIYCLRIGEIRSASWKLLKKLQVCRRNNE